MRGIYDVSGLRADADVMLWLHGADRRGPAVGAPRAAPRPHCSTPCCRPGTRWACTATPSSTSAHVPGFLRGVDAQGVAHRLPVRAQLRLVPAADEERAACSPTTAARAPRSAGSSPTPSSAFALGDYEWLLPLEADELVDLVDLMRDLRDTDARRHVRDEVPFYTGRRIAPPTRRGARDARRPVLAATPPRRGPSTSSGRRLRRDPARRLRRTRGAGRRHPVPAQRHARPRHPRRAPRRGRPPLPPLRRGQPDQRAEPRAEGRARGRARRARHRPARALGQPQLGPVPRRRAARGARRRLHERCSRSPPAPTRSYSSCRQYREDFAQALADDRARRARSRSTRCASSSTTPASCSRSSRACATASPQPRLRAPGIDRAAEVEVLFATHSIPTDGCRASRARPTASSAQAAPTPPSTCAVAEVVMRGETGVADRRRGSSSTSRAPAPPQHAVARARHQRRDRRAARAGSSRPSSSCRSASSATTWRCMWDLDNEAHRDRRGARPARRARADARHAPGLRRRPGRPRARARERHPGRRAPAR